MNPLASELNDTLSSNAPELFEMLSNLGKELFFPKGILSQSAEAKTKATKFNATIGISTENGQPMFLPSVNKYYSELDPKEIYPYAPPAGRPKLRELWKNKIYRENSSLKSKSISNPVVTNALTHGLSVVADLFAEKGDLVISPDKLWGNYRLTFNVRRGTEMKTFPIFNNENGFNTDGLGEVLEQASKNYRKVILLLNFPNNPTGYTIKPNEAEKIVKLVNHYANNGLKIVTVCDDAYFGLFFEDSIKESLFSELTNKNKNILAVKIDGATKEHFAWGFRTGFITFGYESKESDSVYEVLEKKVMGCIRGAISNVVHSSQSIIEHALQQDSFINECNEKAQILKERALHLKSILDDGKYSKHFDYYPFNSGYFMCIKLHKIDAEKLRLKLLNEYGVGTISINPTDLRVAFSCIEKDDLQELFDIIYQACEQF